MRFWSNIKRAVQSNPKIKMLNITVHHTCIVCDKDNLERISEGIHQDGSDYLVSAYVLERCNIEGGASVIFGEDKSTEILRTTYMPIWDTLPDLHTSLWHYVEPIEVAKDASLGWRSSVGLDLDIMELYPDNMSFGRINPNGRYAMLALLINQSQRLF